MIYVQIDKGHCAGDRKLFAEIGEALRATGKFNVVEDTMIVTIKKIEEKEVVADEPQIEEKVVDDLKIKEEDKNATKTGRDSAKDNAEDSKKQGTA